LQKLAATKKLKMAPWIKPAAQKSVGVLGKLTVASIGLTCLYAGMERASDQGKAIPGCTLRTRKSGTW